MNHLSLKMFRFLFVLIFAFPCFYSQNYDICRDPFQCGSITNISYPFWGANRPVLCGHPGFELTNCQDDVPLLNISSNFYRVLEINHPNQTVKVARQDLWNNMCPTILYNTTLNPNLFRFSSDSNITMYYNCTMDQSNLSNQFICDVNGEETINFFRAGETSGSGPGSGLTCDNNIFVPVNHTAAQALQNPSSVTFYSFVSSINYSASVNLSANSSTTITTPATPPPPPSSSSSIDVLQSALASGFTIQWLAHNDYCASCARWGGVCGYNPVPASVFCYTGMSGTNFTGPPSLPEFDHGGNPIPSPAPAPNIYLDDSPFDSGAHTGHSEAMKIVIGLLISITCLAILVVYLKRRGSSNVANKESNQTVQNFLVNRGSLAPKRYNYTQIKKMTKSFKDELGKGGYGSVYKGILTDGSLVAVKLLKEMSSDGEEFINEVASISRTSHVNIVNLLGFCYDNRKRALVYEFMPNNSLDKFISDTGQQLDWKILSKIAVGVARGLEYLHGGCNTRIVHFDIKPQNILLDEDFCPKISDFGLAKLCKKKQSILSMLGTRGTIGYIAPEVFLRNYGAVSHKSDVYSYGMTVLEMAGAKKFVGVGSICSSEDYFPDKIYAHFIMGGSKKCDDLMSEEEEEITRKMFFVGFWCIQTIPSDRPPMSKVVEMLEGSLQSIQIPPKPFLFAPKTSGQEIPSSASVNLDTEDSIESWSMANSNVL